jgi:hypothetical protein
MFWQLTEALESSGPMQVFEISWEAVQEMGKMWDVANNCHIILFVFLGVSTHVSNFWIHHGDANYIWKAFVCNHVTGIVDDDPHEVKMKSINISILWPPTILL